MAVRNLHHSIRNHLVGAGMSKPTVIIIHETVLQSLARDAGTFFMLAALIGLGVLLQSVALQWVGAIVGFMWIVAKGSKPGRSVSIVDARKRLDELESAQ